MRWNILVLMLWATAAFAEEQQVVKEDEPPHLSRLAVKWAPGAAAPLSVEQRTVGPPSFVHALGFEFRFWRMLGARIDVDFHGAERIWSKGLKVTPFPWWRVRPFASASLAVHESDLFRRFAFGVMAAAGVDVTLWDHVFVTAEGRYDEVVGDCCGLPKVSGLIGAGVQFW